MVRLLLRPAVCRLIPVLLLVGWTSPALRASEREPAFRVIAFYTGRNDPAHVSFCQEASRWFQARAAENHFAYEATTDWSRLNAKSLAAYQVVLFLDTRPDDPVQRAAFQQYMEQGGAWLGFHFAAFALTPSAYPQDWDWYHERFLGSGSYSGNTWRPTPAILRVGSPAHPATRTLPATFRSAPNEWYRWSNDLRQNPDIQILLSIDPGSFPLGTDPKPHEIWHEGYYPVAWTNTKYRMVYVNMGHNDMDYGKTNAALSSTFASPEQNRFILQALLWLGESRPSPQGR